MNARIASINALCMGAVFVALAVIVAIFELAVAVKLQFSDQIFGFGPPWPIIFNLPKIAVPFAAYAGIMLWLATTRAMWAGISEESDYGSVIFAMIGACLASFSIMTPIVDPRIFPVVPEIAVWSNAALWIFTAMVSIGTLMDELEDYKMRHART